MRFIRLVEDRKIQTRINKSFNHPNRKNESSFQKSYRAKPYSRSENHWVNALEDEKEDEVYLEISNYPFYVNVLGLLYAMQNLGEMERLPKKNEKTLGWKDKSK